jgi:hypothetical protein
MKKEPDLILTQQKDQKVSLRGNDLTEDDLHNMS